MKILVVEDEGLIANNLADTLRRNGYEVSGIADSGEEALQKVKSLKPDLVLMDIHLSGTMDGIETAEKVRSGFFIPVIFLTAHYTGAFLDRAKKACPFGYLVKPIREADLISAIEVAFFKHHTEQKLRQREAWLTTTLRCAGDGVVITDAFGHIEYLNDLSRRILGIPNDEVIGARFCDVVQLKSRLRDAPVGDLIQLAILQGATMSIGRDLIFTDAFNQEINLEGEVALCETEGIIVGAVLTFRDVTVRNHKDNQRQQDLGTTACARLATAMSIELRKLLAASVADLDDPAQIDRSASETNQLTEQLRAGSIRRMVEQLDVVRRRNPAFPTATNLNTMIAEVRSGLLNNTSPNITVTSHLDPDLPSIYADPSQIKQAITNLILHSQDCMPLGGAIKITTRTSRAQPWERTGLVENYVTLTVTNTGPGMNTDEAHRLFEPFSGADPSRDPLDLRLFIVHDIVSNAGGSIWAKVMSGKGMSFEVLLPRCVENNLRCPTPETAGAAVLVLHGDPEVRALISATLTGQGYEALEAPDFKEALEWMAAYPGLIAVLVADLNLQQMSDPSLIQQISVRHPAMKILVTGDHSWDPSIKMLWIEHGAHFLAKPFRFKELVPLINSMLADSLSMGPTDVPLTLGPPMHVSTAAHSNNPFAS